MRRALLIFAACFLLAAGARAQLHSELPPPTVDTNHEQTVDAIAARIEDDILTESEVNELAAFQTLVDGGSKSRAEIIQELADQWIVRGEAATTRYPEPAPKDIDTAYAQLQKHFPSPDAFKARCDAVGLSDPAIRRLLSEQLYLARFLDFRFRPAAQVTDQQIATYYKDSFVPQLQKHSEAAPPLDQVEDQIREVLVQRAISERATAWLDDTRERLHIDVLPTAAGTDVKNSDTNQGSDAQKNQNSSQPDALGRPEENSSSTTVPRKTPQRSSPPAGGSEVGGH